MNLQLKSTLTPLNIEFFKNIQCDYMGNKLHKLHARLSSTKVEISGHATCEAYCLIDKNIMSTCIVKSVLDIYQLCRKVVL